MGMTPREAVVAEAMTWLWTPFHPHGHVKGRDGGCDCLTIITDPFAACGVIVKPEVPDYSGHWHLSKGAPEYYIDGMKKYCDEVTDKEVGMADIAVFHFGHAYSHGAIVIEWPQVIHSINPYGVTLADATNDASLIREARRFPPRFFSPWKRIERAA